MNENLTLGWLLLTTALMWTFNCVRYISQIGKERKPIDPTMAAWDMVLNGGIIAVIIISAFRLIRS